MARISVILPAFNAAATIARAIESVLRQTIDDLELIACDDESADETHAILEAIADRRVRTVRQPHAGRGAARNRALAEARAPYVALLDADDWWLPTKLEGDLRCIEEAGAPALIYANLWVMDRAGLLYRTMNGRWTVAHSGAVLPYLLRGNFVPTSTIVLPRQTALTLGFDPAIVRGQDWDFLLRASVSLPFHYRNEVVGFYDAHSWGSEEKRVATCRGGLQTLEKFRRTQPHLADAHRDELASASAAIWVEMARGLEAGGHHAEAAPCYASALVHTPDDERLAWSHAMALYRAQDWHAARHALRAYVTQRPWPPEPRFYLGNVHLALGDADAARAELSRALYRGPLDQQFPECVNNLGVAFAQLGQAERGIELFSQALQQREHYSDARWNLLTLQGVSTGPLRWTRQVLP